MEQALCGATFRVRAPIPTGCKVGVVGTSAALGNWNPANAVVLSTTAESYPLWFTSKPVYVPINDVCYKYIVIADGKQPQPEGFDGVRPLEATGREVMVDDVLDAVPVGGAVPMPEPLGSPSASTRTGAGAMSRQPQHAGRAGDAVEASPALAGHHADGQGVASGGAAGHAGQGHRSRLGAHSGKQGEGATDQNGRPSTGTNGASRLKEKQGLNEHDGVLIVQYQLPVRLYKRGAPVSPTSQAQTPMSVDTGAAEVDNTPRETVRDPEQSPTSARAAGSSTAASGAGNGDGNGRDPYNGWAAEWDEEALLAPKGGMVRALRSVRVKWIGTCPVDVPHEDEEAVTRLLETMNCIPVFMPPATHRAFYDGYCRDTLWPVFHNVIDVYGELPTRWWVRERQSDRWKAYMDANGKFAVTVVENYHEGDLVWIQDFHLLLVPNLLARRHIAPTALFLHIPFPSSEIFRSLSVRDELLRGMLSADHIGFHLFEYARHFLTSCRRILGLTHTVRRGGCLAIEYQGREVLITVSHVGVEPSFLLSSFKNSPQTVLSAAGWRRMFPGVNGRGAKIVAGIDSVERLKGVPLKLRAWEAYLASHPQDVGTAVLVQICVEDSVRPGDKQEASASEIISLVDRINARFGRPGMPAVHLDIRATQVPLQERLALWAAADVFVNTSIRDGLSLFPFEYTYIRGASECLPATREACAAKAAQASTAGAPGIGSNSNSDAELAAAALAACDGELSSLNPGVLVLSEFTGGSRVLFGALKINPWKLEEVQSAIDHALHVSAEEAEARAESNLQYVRGNTTAAWAERVLVDLKAAGKKGSTGRTYMGYGLGLGYRLMGFGSSFRPLNVEHVLTAYRRAKHRLFVFDYGGTLNVRDSGEVRQKAFESGLLHGKDAAPPLTTETKKALRLLSEDPRNTVFVVSGKEKAVLAQAFASLPHVGLAAEHGFYFRWGAPPPAKDKKATGSHSGSRTGLSTAEGSQGGSGHATPVSESPSAGAKGRMGPGPMSLALPGNALGDNGQPWETCVPNLPMDEWKQLAGSIMEMYAARTNGTFILRKGSAVSWHYSDADPEFGSMQAKEMSDHLTGVLSGYPVDVLSGHGYVEVRPKGVDKGAVLEIIMNRLEGRGYAVAGQGPAPPAVAAAAAGEHPLGGQAQQRH